MLNNKQKKIKTNVVTQIGLGGSSVIHRRPNNKIRPREIENGRRVMRKNNVNVALRKFTYDPNYLPNRSNKYMRSRNMFENQQQKHFKNQLKTLLSIKKVLEKHNVPQNVTRKISNILISRMKNSKV